LAGRLTDLNSAPLAGVAVVLRNGSTGAETRTVTTRNGNYRFASLDAGEYTLAADSAQLGRGELDGVVISGGHEARIQAAIDLEPEARSTPALASNTNPAQPREPAIETHTVSSAPIAVIPASAEPPHQPALSAPVQFAAVEPVRLKQSNVEPEVLEPERHEPALPAPAAIETAALATPAVLPARPPSLPAPDPAVSFAVGPSAFSGVQPMISTRPLQLLPIAAAIARVDPVIHVLQTTVSDTDVAALPATGRNWQNFAVDTPATSDFAGSSQPVYRGEDQAAAEITIDGAPTQLAFGAAADTSPSNPDSGTHAEGASMGQSWNGGRGFSMSEAGIRQVETVAGNVEAEEARGIGGRIAVKTAQGGSQVHGQAFLFDRQNTWGAQNPFSQWIENTGTAAAPAFTAQSFTPPDHEMSGGAGLGGDLRRNKLFWFAAIDSYRRNNPGLSK